MPRLYHVWIGAKKPYIEGLRCDLIFRDGMFAENENSDDWAFSWNWETREPDAGDIIAWREIADD